MTPELIITTPDGGSRAVRLEGSRYTLGRATGNELSLPEDAGLSRQHLLLELQEGAWILTDLGSKNGTLLNGVRLTSRHVLQPGDVVTASYTKLIFGESTGDVTTPRDRTLVFQPGAPLPGDTVIGVRLTDLEPWSQWWHSPVTALLHATRELAVTRRLSQLFSLVFQLAGEVAGGAEGALLTREGNELIVRARSGAGFQIPAAVRDEVLMQGSPLLNSGMPGFMAIPLQVEDRVTGMLYFHRTPEHPAKEFTTEDLQLLTALGNVAAACAEVLQASEHEDARRILRAEIDQAAAIKKKFMPVTPPMMPGFEVSFYHQPCRTVAGDYFQFLTQHPGRLGVIMSDIAGRGLPVALILNNLNARIAVLAEIVEEPGQFLTRLNRMVSDIRPDNRLLTMFYCVADALAGVVTYSNGGHIPALLVRESGHQEQLRRGGMALGAMSRMQFESGQAFLYTGDLLAVYSDGLIEACNASGEELGQERLTELLMENRTLEVAEIEKKIVEKLQEWSGGTQTEDDVTLLILKKMEC